MKQPSFGVLDQAHVEDPLLFASASGARISHAVPRYQINHDQSVAVAALRCATDAG